MKVRTKNQISLRVRSTSEDDAVWIDRIARVISQPTRRRTLFGALIGAALVPRRETRAVELAPSPAGPVISDVQALEITATSATIAWTTDAPADSIVEYGTTRSLGHAAADSALTTTHRVRLSGLHDDTTYHYRLRSRGAQGQAVTKQDRTFATAAVRTAPVNVRVYRCPPTHELDSTFTFYAVESLPDRALAAVDITLTDAAGTTTRYRADDGDLMISALPVGIYTIAERVSQVSASFALTQEGARIWITLPQGDCRKEACRAGVTCRPSQVDCGYVCTELGVDHNNCGSCGTICPSGVCRSGACQPDEGAVPAKYIGDWEAVGSANPPQMNDMILTVQGGEIGEAIAATLYRSFGCDGTLVLDSLDLRALQTTEHLTHNAGQCVDGAQVTLTMSPEGYVVFTWTDPSTGESMNGQLVPAHD